MHRCGERLDFSGEPSDGVSLVFVTGVGLRFDPVEVCGHFIVFFLSPSSVDGDFTSLLTFTVGEVFCILALGFFASDFKAD